MAEVFNQNPSAFVDMNDLFTVLNDKVGLTSTQWQKAIENTNYLYNHLGLADVSVGTVETVFTEPATFADVNVTHREVTVGDKTTDYFDYVFYIPSPKIEASLTSTTSLLPEEVGITVNTEPVYNTVNGSQLIVGYKFNFDATVQAVDYSAIENKLDVVKSKTLAGGTASIEVNTEVNTSAISNRFYVNSQQIYSQQDDRFLFEVNNNGVYYSNGLMLPTENDRLVSLSELNSVVGNIENLLTQINTGVGV